MRGQRTEAAAPHFLKALGHFARNSGGAFCPEGPGHIGQAFREPMRRLIENHTGGKPRLFQRLKAPKS